MVRFPHEHKTKAGGFTMNAAVFLDRDNTLIENDGDLGEAAGVRLVQGGAAAIGSLCGLGYKVVVVSNQGGVARGKYTESDVDAVHQRINDLVRKQASGASIDRFYYCPYHPKGTVEKYRREHEWRKPKSGMLLQAAKDLDLDLEQSWMIGDQICDVAAGDSAGTRTILLQIAGRRGQFAPSTEQQEDSPAPHYVASSLVEAIRIVAKQRKPENLDEIGADEPRSKRWTTAGLAAIRRRPGHPDATPLSHASTATAGKPTPSPKPKAFRPWNAPSTDQGASPPSPGTPDASSTPTLPTTAPATTPKSASADTTANKPAPVPKRPTRTPSPPMANLEPTLRQILQELRNQHATVKDLSSLAFVAIVLQLLAALCLVAAVLMGQGTDLVFFKWLGTGLLVQLAAIATLLFDR